VGKERKGLLTLTEDKTDRLFDNRGDHSDALPQWGNEPACPHGRNSNHCAPAEKEEKPTVTR